MAKTNFKKLLIEKGEKIGLAIAGSIAVSLVLTQLFWPGYGLLAPSSKEFKSKLEDMTKTVDARMSSEDNKPQEGTPDMPDPTKNPKKGAKLDTFATQTIDKPEKYQMADLFAASTPLDTNRRQPSTFQPIEGKAAFLYAQLRSYMLSKDATQIGVLDGAPPMGSAGGLRQAAGFYGGDRGPGAGPMPMTGGGRGGRGNVNLGQGNTGNPETGGLSDGPAAKFRMIDVSKLATQPNVRLAETVRPLRMVLLAASFPYRAQLDEFRTKLRLPSRAAVLAETSLDTDAMGQALPAFRFLNVKVERVEVDPQGKPLTGKKWTEINLTEDYKPYVVLSGRRLEPDDATLDSISFDRMVMPRLAQIRENQYPRIEESLPTLAAALAALKGKQVTPSAPSILNAADDFDPLSRVPNNQQPGMGPGGERPGPMVNPRPGPGNNPVRGPGTGPGMNLPEIEPPDHCLVRIVDVKIEPGKAYRYRVQVAMANPNYKRTDVANPRYAEKQDLATNNLWYELPDTVVVPPEQQFYAVDQKDIDGKDYKGLNAEARPGLNQVAIQVHKWLEDVINPSNRGRAYIGEWVVAERLFVGKGEYAGRTPTIELPVWVETREKFIVPKKKDGMKETSGLPVPFGTKPQDAVVVDFSATEVKVDYTEMKMEKPVKVSVRDTQRTEVLLWSPDGKLLAMQSTEDAENAERKTRLDAYRARIKEVKGGTPAIGTGPFGGTP